MSLIHVDPCWESRRAGIEAGLAVNALDVVLRNLESMPCAPERQEKPSGEEGRPAHDECVQPCECGSGDACGQEPTASSGAGEGDPSAVFRDLDLRILRTEVRVRLLASEKGTSPRERLTHWFLAWEDRLRRARTLTCAPLAVPTATQERASRIPGELRVARVEEIEHEIEVLRGYARLDPSSARAWHAHAHEESNAAHRASCPSSRAAMPALSKAHLLRIHLLAVEWLLCKGLFREALELPAGFEGMSVSVDLERAPFASLGRAHLLAGQALLLNGRAREAEAQLERALLVSETGPCRDRSAHIRLRADALQALAALEIRRGALRASMARLQAEMDLEIDHGMIAEVAETRAALAGVLARLGSLREAADGFDRAARTFASLAAPARESIARLEGARIEIRLGDWEKARAHALRTAWLARRVGAAGLCVEALAALSMAHLQAQHGSRALRAFSCANALAQKTDVHDGLCALLEWTAAHLKLWRGDLAFAEAHAREALRKAGCAPSTTPSAASSGAGSSAPSNPPAPPSAAHSSWVAGQRLLGEILLTQGRAQEARGELAQARSAAMQQGDVCEHAIAEIAFAKAILATRASEEDHAGALRLRRRAILRLSAAGVPSPHIDAIRRGPVLLRVRSPLAVERPRTAGRGRSLARTQGPERWEAFGIVTRSAKLDAELLHLARVAPSRLPVLIHGETGSGKEMVAGAVHQMSGRSGRFVTFNAATGQNDLFEAELFGHRKGAFTGAHRDRPGVLAQAEKGTLFLDEIADLHPPAQAALLRFLDTGEARAVGSDEVRKIEVRLVAASLRSLRREVARGRFRQDLYFRLAGAEIDLPPLRARPEDILPLVAHFAKRRGISVEQLEDALCGGLDARLLNYAWPGNVRQLSHWVDQLAALLQCGVAREQMRPVLEKPLIARGRADTQGAALDRLAEMAASGPDGSEAQVTREDLSRLLAAHKGNISAVARDLNTYRTRVYRLLKRMGIDLARRQPQA
ncbi:MAG: sigma-54-dependent Fis family transcriptional regulator [Candidatus Eisenbacteria bacterium]|nr:sigma-54-dependent Fis family transcriptional regulator [Candidatus Eisenbacteria bacterium]